jgi:hypothetical protein
MLFSLTCFFIVFLFPLSPQSHAIVRPLGFHRSISMPSPTLITYPAIVASNQEQLQK